jgi:hypothetical protein
MKVKRSGERNATRNEGEPGEAVWQNTLILLHKISSQHWNDP